MITYRVTRNPADNKWWGLVTDEMLVSLPDQIVRVLDRGIPPHTNIEEVPWPGVGMFTCSKCKRDWLCASTSERAFREIGKGEPLCDKCFAEET